MVNQTSTIRQFFKRLEKGVHPSPLEVMCLISAVTDTFGSPAPKRPAGKVSCKDESGRCSLCD